MPPVPVLKPRQLIDTFAKFGWEIARQKGSHIIMVKEGELATLSIPNHKEVARGTLRSLVRTAGLTMQEFLNAL